MDKPLDDIRVSTARATPRDFFLWAGAMVALYTSVFAFIALIFDYINYSFPDPLSYSPADPYQGGIAYEMALFIVLAPVCIFLMRLIHRDIERDHSRGEIWVRRWALYLVLFVAGATIVGDLVTLLYTFLAGEEITMRFLLKVLVVLLVAMAGFMHFLADLRGYWEANPTKSKIVSVGVLVLGVVAIVAGFFIVGTPMQARLYRFDAQKVSDLQNIQYQIVNYWQQKQKLPGQLSDLSDSLSYDTLPIDSQTGEQYSYKSVGALSFELCASFNAQNQGSIQNNYSQSRLAVPVPVGGGKAAPDNLSADKAGWQHAAGSVCFERTIDPQRYPPYTQKI